LVPSSHRQGQNAFGGVIDRTTQAPWIHTPVIDISDTIFAEFATAASFNGSDLASGAIIRPGAEMGVLSQNNDIPTGQRQNIGDFATIRIRKVDLPGVTPKYRDVVSDGAKDWHLQPNVKDDGGCWTCTAIGQFRAKGPK
jgi:hypothetical protein